MNTASANYGVAHGCIAYPCPMCAPQTAQHREPEVSASALEQRLERIETALNRLLAREGEDQ